MSGHKTAGAGSPIWFNCPGCYRANGLRPAGARHVVRTGRTKPRPRSSHSATGIRSLATSHEYECSACGHRGWTCHSDILRRPR